MAQRRAVRRVHIYSKSWFVRCADAGQKTCGSARNRGQCALKGATALGRCMQVSKSYLEMAMEGKRSVASLGKMQSLVV